jgi:hypothetical protein
MNRLVTLLVLACATAGALAADKQQVYKWTDANGVVHFSDAPPSGDAKNVESLRLIGGTSTASDSAAADDKTKPSDDKSKPASPADNADNQAKECERAKNNLVLLQSNIPVNEITPDGKEKPLDAKDRQARVADVNARIARLCGK